jgi:hypothetical protein
MNKVCSRYGAEARHHHRTAAILGHAIKPEQPSGAGLHDEQRHLCGSASANQNPNGTQRDNYGATTGLLSPIAGFEPPVCLSGPAAVRS